MDPVLAKEIQNLIDDNIGDHHRLEFILESMKNNKKIYNSDQKYLAFLLSQHSKDEDILERLNSLNEKPEEPVVTFADDADKPTSSKPIPKKLVRPTGITVFIILSIFSIVYSVASWIYFSAYVGELAYLPQFFPIASILIYLYVIMIFFNLVVTFGLYSGKSWGRTIVLITSCIGLIVSIIGFNPIGLILFGILVWYLRKEHVKKYFGVN